MAKAQVHGGLSLAVRFSTGFAGSIFLSRMGSLVAVALLLMCSVPRAGMAAGTPSGTVIQNTASISFRDVNNVSYDTVSNAVTVTVANIAALIVTPKQTTTGNTPNIAFVAGQTITRIFTITNTGNIAAAYVVSSVASSAGTIVSIAFLDASGAGSPILVGKSVSPTLSTGQTQSVAVTLSTQGISLGTAIVVTLVAATAPGNAGGVQSDTGTVVALAAAGITWGAPNASAGTPPIKLVNGLNSAQTQAGATVTYTLAFENYGGFTATNVEILDNVPLGITPNPNSVMVNGVALAGVQFTNQTLNSVVHDPLSLAGQQARQPLRGQFLVIPLKSVVPLSPEVITFTATVDSGDALGTTYINNATLEADNAPPLAFLPASVFVGTASAVYDGTIGPTKPIVGAQIALVDPQSGLPFALTGTVLPANPQNVNPFVTAADGQYGFGLAPTQYGRAGGAVTYNILISAPGYLNRKIQATLTPDASGLYYSVTLNALDGQSIALAGAYGLTKLAVTLKSIYGMLGNLPLFTPNVVTVTKSADRSTASGGDRVVFTVTFSGNGTTTLNQTEIVDTLPPGLVYGPGTGRLDAMPVEPTVQGRVLTWSLPTLSAAHTIMYATVVMPNVTAGTTLTNAVSVSAVLPYDPNTSASASTTTDVHVTAGLFSDRIIITGRVFSDEKKTGRFVPGDHGVPGVRIYLEDGESVATDSLGLFTFPSARPGMHVMRLDITTLPRNVEAYSDRRYDSERSVRRLVHGISDSGLMQDVNFALQPVP